MKPSAAPERRLDTGSKLFYGFGSVAFGVKDNGFSYLLLLFYNQVLGLPAPLVGLGGLAINLLAFAVLLKPDATHKVGQLNPVGYAHYGLVASAVIFVSILVSTAGTQRHVATLRPPPPRRRLTAVQVLGEMKQSLSNRSFLFLLAATVTSALATGLGASLNTYFNTFFWGFSAGQISLFTLGVFLSAFIALPAAPGLSRRFGKRRTAIVFTVLSAVFGLGPLFLRLAGLMPANGAPALVGIIFCTSIITTTFIIIAQTMGSSMVADVVEAAELKTGRRSEGLFFAASAFIQKAVSGFGILAASLLITAIGLTPGANPATVPAEVTRNLALAYAPAIIGLHAIGLSLLLGYRINRASHQETLRQLAAEAEALAHPVLAE